MGERSPKADGTVLWQEGMSQGPRHNRKPSVSGFHEKAFMCAVFLHFFSCSGLPFGGHQSSARLSVLQRTLFFLLPLTPVGGEQEEKQTRYLCSVLL